jgi:uncharacterized delta-60 repeat protein
MGFNSIGGGIKKHTLLTDKEVNNVIDHALESVKDQKLYNINAWKRKLNIQNYDAKYIPVSILSNKGGGKPNSITCDERYLYSAGGADRKNYKIDPCNISEISWAKAYYGVGGSSYPRSIQQTSDGGYIVAGMTQCFGAAVQDVWVIKLNSYGEVEWQKRYGGTLLSYAYSVRQTRDGGYIVAGYTRSFGATGYNMWILKLNSDGSIDWQKRYGISSDDRVYAIKQTSDGGYIVGGQTGSTAYFWILKLNNDGSIDWQKKYTLGGANTVTSIIQTLDGGYIVTGRAAPSGIYIWVIKLTSTGSITWQKRYGQSPTANELPYQILQTSDGGYIVVGRTAPSGFTDYDAWIIKLTSSGVITWQKKYRGSVGEDYFYGVQEIDDGEYVVSGGNQITSPGLQDCWVLRLNNDGTIIWQKRYGASGLDEALEVLVTNEGGLIVIGHSNSFGGGVDTFWIVKLKDDGKIVFTPASGAQVIDTDIVPVTTIYPYGNTSISGINTTVIPVDTTATAIDTNCLISEQAPEVSSSVMSVVAIWQADADTSAILFDGTNIYIGDLGNPTQIYKIDRDTMLPIPPNFVGDIAFAETMCNALTCDGNFIYACFGSNEGAPTGTTISKIDPITMTTVVPNGRWNNPAGYGCFSLAFDGKYLYAQQADSSVITKINPVNMTTASAPNTWTAPGGEICKFLAFDGSYLYVGVNTSPAKIYKINPITMTTISIWPGEALHDNCWSLLYDGKFLYIGTTHSTYVNLIKIDTSTMTTISKWYCASISNDTCQSLTSDGLYVFAGTLNKNLMRKIIQNIDETST